MGLSTSRSISKSASAAQPAATRTRGASARGSLRAAGAWVSATPNNQAGMSRRMAPPAAKQLRVTATARRQPLRKAARAKIA